MKNAIIIRVLTAENGLSTGTPLRHIDFWVERGRYKYYKSESRNKKMTQFSNFSEPRNITFLNQEDKMMMPSRVAGEEWPDCAPF